MSYAATQEIYLNKLDIWSGPRGNNVEILYVADIIAHLFRKQQTVFTWKTWEWNVLPQAAWYAACGVRDILMVTDMYQASTALKFAV